MILEKTVASKILFFLLIVASFLNMSICSFRILDILDILQKQENMYVQGIEIYYSLQNN